MACESHGTFADEMHTLKLVVKSSGRSLGHDSAVNCFSSPGSPTYGLLLYKM